MRNGKRVLFVLAALLALAPAGFCEEQADVIIVLGARVMEDGDLSTTLLHRVETAYSVYESGRAARFIVCGAQGDDEPCTEARAMADDLIGRGVPEEQIFLDENSVNTRENIQNAREIMNDRGMKNAILVTSDYHLKRALRLCADAGVSAEGVPAPGPDQKKNQLKARAKEALSWAKYLFESTGK